LANTDISRLAIAKEDKRFTPRRRRRWVKWAVIAVGAAAAAGAFAMRQANAPQPVELATVSTAYPTQSFTLLNATGRVTAQRKAAVSTKATGRLEWLGVLEGSKVKQGDVIARLESFDVAAGRDSAAANVRAARANLEQGRAELTDAERNYQRALDLHGKKFIADAALDQAKARLDKARAAISSLNAAIGVAEANVRSAGVSVEQTLIRAPFDGVILTKNANVGDIITPFSSAADSKGAVVTMADMTTLEVEADVAEASIAKITLGAPAEIQLDALPETRLLGKVSRIVPTVDRSKATVLVKVSFVEQDARVLPDMSAKVAFLQKPPTAADRKPVTTVRADAVAQRPRGTVVYVQAGEKARETAVTTGRKLGDLVEVSGLKPGDKVVLKPSEKVIDGARVAVVKK
jgi:RND family efflux transporter MFP subunit